MILLKITNCIKINKIKSAYFYTMVDFIVKRRGFSSYFYAISCSFKNEVPKDEELEIDSIHSSHRRMPERRKVANPPI